MSSNSEDPKTTNIMKANRLLQAKAGVGAVNNDKVNKSQKIIDATKSQVDFLPLAEEYLEQLAQAIKDTKANKKDEKALLSGLIDPVMQIKANAAMFNYDLVGSLASTVLNFLESVETINKDLIDIVESHHETISYIIDNKIAGTGDDYGEELEKELKKACKRYFQKHG